MRHLVAALACAFVASCTTSAPPSAASTSATAPNTALEIEGVRGRFAGYTLDEARRTGYEPDRFCLDAAAFGKPPQLGAMGYHATNAALLRGPIAVERPQALMFDGQGRLLGVEYEIVADAVREAPRLFGQTFAKLPAHPGVQHEHYALHLWFIPNPNGQLADFNPSVACPAGSAPAGGGVENPMPTPEHGAGH